MLGRGSPDDTTGDLFSRVTGRLAVKIICHGMEDDHLSQKFSYGEFGEDDCAPCHALIDKDGRQIPSMIWVWAVMGIIMAACIGKGIFFIAAA